MMPIDDIPDWERRLERQDAFWEREIIDRPVVCFALPKLGPRDPAPPAPAYPSVRDRWMDTDRVVRQAVANAEHTEYFGDALPTAWPNLGPELFSAFFGAELIYTDDTAWAVPNLEDWADADALEFSKDNFYWKKLVEMTEALLEAGQGRFYTGISDIHPGGDAVTAFRDPMVLCTDLLAYPDEVKALIDRVTEVYFDVLDFFHDKLEAAGQAITSWPGIVSSRRWYVPSNDFSCMVSAPMFEEFFLPGIVEECRHTEAAIYHLDGPGALRFLDLLLGIDELNAIQWVFGAGNGRATDWLDVYKRCQDARKGVQIFAGVDELDTLIEHLRPEGVWLSVGGVQDADHARAVIEKLSRWR